MNKEYINKIVCGDVLDLLPDISSDSIDIVLTDPPYFLDKMDSEWNHGGTTHYVFIFYCVTEFLNNQHAGAILKRHEVFAY